MPEQVPLPSIPKFTPPPGLDTKLYDPTTGFGLFGTPVYGTRWGSGPLPIIKAEETRPVCIEFHNTGKCTRRGPHGQSCMYRHVAKDDPNKVDQNKPQGAAAKIDVRQKLPPGWVSESSKRHPKLKVPAQAIVETKLADEIKDWVEAREAERAARAKAAEEQAAQREAEEAARAEAA
eukprot:CAMPEP_0119424986 /NCGR_PEP_ID=MMETSP1335-20130426/33638_1 /TAXON_ID=259385 /ORGANISM="Chrysoculter rhomboideus, Strain RCC1486" /LENGTH=176 /DNA_ID=CAMNT_0007450537 /DNA_START=82 /DNA_END=608 /DNA_ORIENTATION=+